MPYAEVAELRVARGPDERVDGRRSLVLELGSGELISVSEVWGLGAVLELADALRRRLPAA